MSIVKRARSAITGRFVSWWYAKTKPRTTIVETIERPDPPAQDDENVSPDN